jgi:hypothetical protein
VPASGPEETIRIPGSNGGRPTTLAVARTVTSSVKTVAAPVERIWVVLPTVYESLGIPVTERDATGHTFGARSLKARRRLGEAPLSRFLDCGSTQGGPSADTYEVLLTVMTQVTPGAAADSPTVTVTVDGMGRPVFVSADYVHCGSTGVLEKRIFDALSAQLAH